MLNEDLINKTTDKIIDSAVTLEDIINNTKTILNDTLEEIIKYQLERDKIDMKIDLLNKRVENLQIIQGKLLHRREDNVDNIEFLNKLKEELRTNGREL